MDIRDDRIIYFTDVNAQWKHYYYMARVVSEGSYFMGPVSAEAMYDGTFHSSSGAGMVVVD